MKKIIFLIISLVIVGTCDANYSHSQKFFDSYNHTTEGTFSPKFNSLRNDNKIKTNATGFDTDNSKSYECQYEVSGKVRCWKYRVEQSKHDNASVIEARVKRNKKLTYVSHGDDFNCSLAKSGVYCWGSNKRGQLGSKTTNKNVRNPLKIKTDIKFKKLYTKAHYACAIDNKDLAYCWGDGTSGEVGNGKKGNFDTPQKVKTDIKFSRLSMSETYVCGIEKVTKDIYCWGKGTNGHSNTSNLDSTVPVKI